MTPFVTERLSMDDRPDSTATDDIGHLDGRPHRRWNPLADEWVLTSADRQRRPWQPPGETSAEPDTRPYDPDCYLCPGNTRANGRRNPAYEGTFVFTNDFAALRPDVDRLTFDEGLLHAGTEAGVSRVLCFSPRHDLTMAAMDGAALSGVIDVWADQTTDLGATYPWVQVFENRGHLMGASNPHPHGQIWASASLPREASREDRQQRRYRSETGSSLLLDYAGQEEAGPRIVEMTAHWLVVVPFWASWPYETLMLPRQPVRRLPELDASQRADLGFALRRLLRRYDDLFDQPFPYSMGWHQAPFGPESTEPWQLHAHFYPPLLRAGVRKFMVGFELLSETQRDLTPEAAAADLRQAAGQPTGND
jgi:UDPglucose--hexose-1-phosphate uridylyltransferase